MTLGATVDAGLPAGGFKIYREAGSGSWLSQEDGSWLHPHLPPGTYFTCRFFSARKHALVDAGTRQVASDRTAYLVYPGGIGSW